MSHAFVVAAAAVRPEGGSLLSSRQGLRTQPACRTAPSCCSKDPSGADEPYDPEWSNFGEWTGSLLEGTRSWQLRDAVQHQLRRRGPVQPDCWRSGWTRGMSMCDPLPPPPPPAAAAGNDSGGECGVATAKTFQMPDTAELGYWPEQGLAAAPTTTGRQEQQRQQQRRANPTLGPNGAAFSAGSAATAVGGAASAAAGNKASRAPNPPFWYSFSYGSVHFTVLSTEHDAAPGSDQFAWLEHDLRRVDRCKTPWLVVSAWGLHWFSSCRMPWPVP